MKLVPLHGPAIGRREPREISIERLRLAQTGREDALHEVVETYQDRVFGLVGRMVGRSDPAMVEDISQECFLRTFRALHRFDPGGPARLSTWILTIATRLCLDHLRRARPVESEGPEPTTAPTSESRLRWASVQAALRRLPADLRATLLLRVVADRTVAETAEALGVDEGTVKSRLSRARARLREALGETT
jgi:RNA polymerase sigma-70 factor (ECF subfamily)